MWPKPMYLVSSNGPSSDLPLSIIFVMVMAISTAAVSCSPISESTKAQVKWNHSPIDKIKVTTPMTNDKDDDFAMRAQRNKRQGLTNIDSNTTPGPQNATSPPNPAEEKNCQSEWQKYFEHRKGSKDELTCCLRMMNCECHKKFEKVPKECTYKCEEGVNVTKDGCTSLPDLGDSSSSSGGFNWLWILIIVAVLMIVIIVVAIFFVYRKKFCGHDSRKDKKHGHITIGNMNVKSEVQWEGKKKRTSSRHSARKATSKRSLKGRSSRQTKASMQKRSSSTHKH